ncbi:hypothetical protein NCCP2145_21760 [Pseudarthrobacter sp. NCCP-2145]|nr:hypothetical protein NCCP2145_21760 [Pseudarthrobacter sp. NCCP-2145]
MAAVVLTAIAGASSFPPILSFVSKALQNPLDTSGQVSVASRIYRPYLDVLDLIQNSPWLGIGPGSSRAYVESLDVGVTTPTLMKVTVEYGVLGLLAFSLLWFSLIQASRLSYLLKLALLVALLVPTDGLTNSLLVPLFTWMLLLTARPQSSAHVPATLSIGRKLKGSY